MKHKIAAILPAAGMSSRMAGEVKKQFIKIGSRPLIAYTLDVFEKVPLIDEILLVVPRGTEKYCERQIAGKYGYGKKIRIIAGGKKRQDSVLRALKKTGKNCSIVVIHDGVRPLVTEEMVIASVSAARKYGAAVLAVPETDTIKKVGYDKSVRTTLDRSGVWRIQTPQAFRFELIKKAYEKAFMDKFYATDDAMLVERLGEKVKIVKGSYNNIKITTREDLVVAETMLSKTKDGLFGIGYDIHRLSENRRLMLGGVRIPFKKGLMGHSDGDALLHSICDAMLGSTGEKDIGNHFPNTDKRYRGISSLILLQKVEKILEGRGYIVKNIDCVVIAESPKIAPYADRMKTKIAEVLKIRKENIGIKATTNEGIGFIGEGGGIAAFSIVSVVKG